MTVVKKTLLVVLWLGMMGGAGGCAVFAWLAATLSPPDPVPAKYVFPRQETVLVLVDDPVDIVGALPVKYELTGRINKELEANEITEHTISYKRLMDLAAATPNFNRLSTAEIGKKIGADIVLYVKIDDFSLRDNPMNPIWRGKFKTSVRVVDVEEGRLWPKDLVGGYPVQEVDTKPIEGDNSSRFEIKLAKSMAYEMANNIVSLFYEHPGSPHGSLPEKDVSSEP